LAITRQRTTGTPKARADASQIPPSAIQHFRAEDSSKAAYDHASKNADSSAKSSAPTASIQVCTDRILLIDPVYDWKPKRKAGRLPRERQHNAEAERLCKIGPIVQQLADTTLLTINPELYAREY